MNKELIDYLQSNQGKLNEHTWTSLGEEFGVQSPDLDRAEQDEEYRKKSIGRKAQSIWVNYLKQKDNLQLTKEVYKDGQLQSEVFQKGGPQIDVDYSQYDIEKFSVCSNGLTWLKGKKKDSLYEENHLESLRKILREEVIPFDLDETKKLSLAGNKSLMIYGSDKHIGALTKESSIYTNKYDYDVMKNRLVDQIVKEVVMATIYNGPFQSIYIMDLGDALDGFNQKTTGGLRETSSHTLPQQYNNREQHDIYVDLHKKLVDRLRKIELNGHYLAENFYFIATSNSNHGGDFEYGAMRTLEEYIKAKYTDMKTHINTNPLNHFFIEDHCIIFGHGKDDEDMKHGMPLNLTDKVENYINDYIQVNKLGDYIITFVTGDLHQSSKNYGKNFRYRKVLSQYGGSKWVHSNYGSSTAGISMEIITPKSPNIIEMDIFFENSNNSNTGILL
jgi:hypothetical protein